MGAIPSLLMNRVSARSYREVLVAIPEAQLETWSQQGSIAQSRDTYASVRLALAASSPFSQHATRIFLQGSYGNDTNVWSESDVDVVIVLDSTFQPDVSSLSELERSAFKALHQGATYEFAEFRADVCAVLEGRYGSAVSQGDKAIAIAANGSRRKADVIPALQYRRYSRFEGITGQEYEEGICFWTVGGDFIANYPRQHSENLTRRHQASQGWLKPLIRIFKNLRGRCVADGLLDSGVAPSYFIEGLLFNVPTNVFGVSYANSFVEAINWIQGQADKSNLVCANEQFFLLRDIAHTCWKPSNCESFLEAMVEAWNSW